MDQSELVQKKKNLAALTRQLNQVLGKGLMLRLKDAEWYLTGVQVGLQSLHAFYEISELVYREYTSNSEGGRRVDNMRRVYQKLTEFAHPDQDTKKRAIILLEIRQPLEMLIREFEGKDARTGGQMRGRKTIVAQLASDINLYLLRLKSFRKMEEALTELLAFKYVFFRRDKRENVQFFCRSYKAYAQSLGFEETEVLYKNKNIKETIKKIREETKNVETLIKMIRQKIYRGVETPPSADAEVDLAEANVIPILQKISEAGFEYLDRAHTAYQHALEMTGGDPALFRRVMDLGMEIDEFEMRNAGHGRAQASA